MEFRTTGRVPDSTVSPMLAAWLVGDGMLTRVANWLTVMNGVPSVAIGSRGKVPPLCVTVISASACRQVVTSANTVSNADGAVVGLRRCNLYGRTQRNALSATM